MYKEIKKLCEEQCITIASLERKAHIGNGVIRRWDEKEPRFWNVIRVTEVLGCKVEDLIGANNEVNDNNAVC